MRTRAACSGANGRGTVDHFGMHGRVDIQVGTLSKAIGALGGYVAGSRDADRLPLSPRAAVPVLDLASAGGGRGLHRRDRRADRGAARSSSGCGRTRASSRRACSALGFNTGLSESPITPVIAGDGALAMKLSDRLFERRRVRAGHRASRPSRATRRACARSSPPRTRARSCSSRSTCSRKVGRELGIICRGHKSQSNSAVPVVRRVLVATFFDTLHARI